ncbi:tyrosine-type recombinase/integrase [Tetragenococcus halophilus]
MKNKGPIKEYKIANGETRYRFKVYLGINPYTGKEVRPNRRGFKTRREASIELKRLKANWLEDIESQYDKQRELENKGKTFEKVYVIWLDEYIPNVDKSTLFKTKQLFDNHILPAFGNLYIKDITAMDAQKQMNVWQKEFVKASTIMSYAGLVFDCAVRLEEISSNPISAIRKPSKKKESKKDTSFNFYDKEELKEFMAAAEMSSNKKAYVFFRLLAFTGIRRGEILALRWYDIDFNEQTLSINKAIAHSETGLYEKDVKTKASNRVISIDDITTKILKEFQGVSDKEVRIFPAENGGILSPAKPRKWLYTIQNYIDKKRKENEEDAKPMKRITTHGFRHTHASLLFEAGASIKDVQYRLGHSDIKTTMDTYTHVTKQAKENLANNFNDYIDF